MLLTLQSQRFHLIQMKRFTSKLSKCLVYSSIHTRTRVSVTPVLAIDPTAFTKHMNLMGVKTQGCSHWCDNWFSMHLFSGDVRYFKFHFMFFRFPMWLCFCFCSFGVWICWNCGSAAEIWSWPNYHRPGRLSSWGGHWFPCDLPSPAWVHHFERLSRPCIPPPCYSNLLVSSLLPSFAQPSHNPSFIPAETSFPLFSPNSL